jgi:hypothetical protein
VVGQPCQLQVSVCTSRFSDLADRLSLGGAGDTCWHRWSMLACFGKTALADLLALVARNDFCGACHQRSLSRLYRTLYCTSGRSTLCVGNCREQAVNAGEQSCSL